MTLFYGACINGPYFPKNIAHGEPFLHVAVLDKIPRVGVQKRDGPWPYAFGTYHFEKGYWRWEPPPDSKNDPQNTI